MAETAPKKTAAKKRRKRSKLFKILVAIGLAGAIGAVVYLNLEKEIPVETFPTTAVDRRNLIHKLTETGSIELVRTVEVKSTISGVIRSLPTETGDEVTAGTLMAIIEPDPDQTLQLFQKRSAVENARINLREQTKGYNRQKTLFEQGMLPSKDFEDSERSLTRARNTLRLAELELEILETKANLIGSTSKAASAELDEVRVLAPITGLVIRRDVEIGEIVASGTSLSGGAVLFEIGDPSQMIVRADIAEIDIGDLQTSQDVEIVVDAYPDTTYHGRVAWIAPVGEKKQGNTIVTFDAEIDILDSEPRLRQGMSCDLDIIITRRDSTLALPIEAVLELFHEDEDGMESEVRGRRGRFVTYVYTPPDSAAGDSAAVAEHAQIASADTAGDSGEGDENPTALSSSDSDDAADASALTDIGIATEDAATAGEQSMDQSPGSQVDDADAIGLNASNGDSVAAVDADTSADAAPDSTVAEVDKGPPQVPLDQFVEVEVQIGLETSNRIEIISGLHAGDWVAADPAVIKQRQKQAAENPDSEDSDD